MIIEKDIKARVDLSAKDISGIINGCDFDVLKEVISKCSNSTLSFIATYYVNTIKENNKNDFEKFVSFVNSLNGETNSAECKKTSKKVDVKKADTTTTLKELNVGDEVFILHQNVIPEYISRFLYGFMFDDVKKKYKKYTIESKRSSIEKTGDVIYIMKDRSDDARMIDFHSNIEKGIKDGLIIVKRNNAVKATE